VIKTLGTFDAHKAHPKDRLNITSRCLSVKYDTRSCPITLHHCQYRYREDEEEDDDVVLHQMSMLSLG